MSSSLRERCQALSESIRKESTIFDRAMLCSSKDDDDDGEVLKEEQNIGGGDDKARIASAAAVVEHESTKIGLLFANQSKESANEEIKPDVANSALDAFHVSLIAFTAYVNAALTRASKSEGECYAKQVKTIGESVLKASASLIDAVGAKKDTVRSLTASVWEQCKSVEKLPRDGKDAVGKALMTHCRFIKDAKREIEEMLSEGEGENDEDEDDERKGDGEKVEDDFGDVIIREEIKDVDREVLKKAKVTIECTFAFLKALVVPLISTSSNSNSKSRKEHATALNEIEKKCKEIRSAVDEIICEAMPPSDADALASEAKKLKEAAQSMMLAVEEVMTGNEETNPIDAAKKALACVHSACDEM